MTNCDEIEIMIKEMKCTGVRVTKEILEARIKDVKYVTTEVAGSKFMHCYLVLDTGFIAVGEASVCMDPSNYRENIGQTNSYNNSFSTLWSLEAYHMMSAVP